MASITQGELKVPNLIFFIVRIRSLRKGNAFSNIWQFDCSPGREPLDSQVGTSPSQPPPHGKWAVGHQLKGFFLLHNNFVTDTKYSVIPAIATAWTTAIPFCAVNENRITKMDVQPIFELFIFFNTKESQSSIIQLFN